LRFSFFNHAIYNCRKTFFTGIPSNVGEFYQLEKQGAHDLTLFLRSILGEKIPEMCQLKRESLVSAFGCALPRVYFDFIKEKEILGNDCVN